MDVLCGLTGRTGCSDRNANGRLRPAASADLRAGFREYRAQRGSCRRIVRSHRARMMSKSAACPEIPGSARDYTHGCADSDRRLFHSSDQNHS